MIDMIYKLNNPEDNCMKSRTKMNSKLLLNLKLLKSYLNKLNNHYHLIL